MHLSTHTAEETEEFASALAGARPGDPRELAVLYLAGDLGAGKTTFARGFLRGLGAADAVRSPTYTLLDLHEVAGLTVLHIDLYRLRDEAELDSLGLSDWARPGCLWLIEWPERAGSRLPPPDLIVSLTAGIAVHEIEARAGTALGEKWLARLPRIALGAGVPGPRETPETGSS